MTMVYRFPKTVKDESIVTSGSNAAVAPTFRFELEEGVCNLSCILDNSVAAATGITHTIYLWLRSTIDANTGEQPMLLKTFNNLDAVPTNGKYTYRVDINNQPLGGVATGIEIVQTTTGGGALQAGDTQIIANFS